MFRTNSPYSPFFTSGLLSQPARDSLRAMPSPKPAPSITLPDLPAPIPRLPTLQLPALDLSHRFSVATGSTVSTRARRHNRSEALARLEGRSRSAPLYPKRSVNFMSMSDDEDDADDEDSELESLQLPPMLTLPEFNPLMEPEDMVLPLPSPFFEAPRSAPQPPAPNPPSQAPSGRQRVKRNVNTNEWFPLKSFMDLHNEEDPTRNNYSHSSNNSTSWTWRSFIEVVNVS